MPQVGGETEMLPGARDEERHLRGRLLAKLDRRGYPKLWLSDGSIVGSGLLEWGPVLREMDLDALRALERVLDCPTELRHEESEV